jgi:predicted enzyme related to lactoylglutathione lyase
MPTDNTPHSFPMNRPCHFEIHSTDPARTLAFFEQVFGWQSHKWSGGDPDGANNAPFDYWLLATGGCTTPESMNKPGINGGLLRSRDGKDRTVNTIQVDDVDRVTQAVVAAGGTVVVPRMPIPGVGYLAYCNDPTGHLFGVMHRDVSAK